MKKNIRPNGIVLLLIAIQFMQMRSAVAQENGQWKTAIITRRHFPFSAYHLIPLHLFGIIPHFTTAGVEYNKLYKKERREKIYI